MTQVRLRLHNVSEETPPWVMPCNAEGLANESVKRSVELSLLAVQDRRDGQTQGSEGLRRRRVILGLSFVGIFSMGLVALYGRLWHREKRSHPLACG